MLRNQVMAAVTQLDPVGHVFFEKVKFKKSSHTINTVIPHKTRLTYLLCLNKNSSKLIETTRKTKVTY